MSQQLYFFKINKKLIKKNLLPLPQKDGEFSYKKFIPREGWDEDGVIFEQVINKISNDNIEELSEDEWFSIYFSFVRKFEKYEYLHYDEKALNNELKSYGLDLFFALGYKSLVIAFFDLMEEYDLVDEEADIHTGDGLKNFLDYAICFVDALEAFLNKERSLDGSLIKKISPNLSNLAATSLEKCKGSEFVTLEDKEDTIAPIIGFLDMFKEKIGDYKGRIVSLHSF